MGESQRANMMGQRVFIIIALMASLCVALPTTDLVVPEAKDAGTTGAKFVQSTLKSGGTETADFLETHDSATNLLSLHAPAMLDELATLSKEAHTSGQTTAIKQLKHVMVLLEATPNGTATDGGTKKLADRVKTMRDVVQSAIVAMQSGLDSDFTAALADLSTLLNVINSTVRTVETSEQTSIKLKAHNWCIAKEAKDNSTKKCRDATTNVTNFDPAIAVNDAFYKHIGSITDCPAGTALVDGKCPAGVVNLDESTLKAGFQDARDAYHELDVTKTSECGIKTVDEDNEGTNQTAYETTIATILDDHVAACNPDSTVYTTAVTSFNTNNGHRAAMYKSLDKIKCYVNNIDNSADAAACISALSTDYATKYTDHTTAAPTCPTRAVYALQISNYESLSLTESWEPSDITCPAVTAPPPAPTPAPPAAGCPVRAENGATVTAGVSFVPEVMFNGNWYPIVRGYFWDNNNGATTVCQGLGYGGFSTGTVKAERTTKTDVNYMWVGACEPDEALTSCTGGSNYWGNFNAHGGFCNAHDPRIQTECGVTVTCN